MKSSKYCGWAQALSFVGAMAAVLCGGAALAGSDLPGDQCNGIVVDISGRPANGAVVELYNNNNDTEEVVAHTITGTNGSFQLVSPGGWFTLVARQQGYPPVCRRFPNPDEEQNLTLMPATNLVGMVVDDAGKPVTNAAVFVSWAYYMSAEGNGGYLPKKLGREIFSTRTGPDGRFCIDGFPTNAMADLMVETPGKYLRLPERSYVSPENMQWVAGQQDIKLTVGPAGSLEGKLVLPPDSKMPPEARLSLNGDRPGWRKDPKEVQPEADGTFHFEDLAPGPYLLRANFGPPVAPDKLSDNPPQLVALPVHVTVEEGKSVHNLQIEATRGGFIEVVAISKPAHEPLTGFSVWAHQQEYHAGAKANSNGVALLRLPLGNCEISAYSANPDARSTMPCTAQVEKDKTNRVELELESVVVPKISGTVRYPDGSPAIGLRLQLLPDYLIYDKILKTDTNGHFELSIGSYFFRDPNQPPCLVARDLARKLAITQELEEGMTNAELRLEPGLTVSGIVEDVNHKPITNATVRYYCWSGRSGYTLDRKALNTDARGRFEITGLPLNRRYSFDVQAKGYGSAGKQIQSDDSVTNRIDLEPSILQIANQSISGQVLDADDKPVNRVEIHVSGDGQPNLNVHTDHQGKFLIDQVCAGTVRLWATKGESRGSANVPAGETNVIIRLEAQSSSAPPPVPKRPSLVGQPLPDLAGLADLPEATSLHGKPLVICLWDINQRPSRRLARLLAEQHAALTQKGVAVLAVQASPTSPEELKTWQAANPLPFPVGRVGEASARTKWAMETESKPWLILVNDQGKVSAEGFAPDELEEKIKQLARP